MVFRNPGDRGYPKQSNWVSKLRAFVFSADEDNFPIDETSFLNSNATDYTSGRFLLAIFRIIQAYFREFSRISLSNHQNRGAAIREIGEQFLGESSVTWCENVIFEE